MRLLLVDLRRGPAPLLVVCVLVLAGAPAASECESAVLSLRQPMWLLVPCLLAAGVWHGGAARRRGVDEAIRAAAAPAYRRAAVEGGSIGLAAAAALVLLLAALTVTGCATGPLAVGAVALVAVAAAGFAGLALGRLAPAPMAAPLTLVVALLVTTTIGAWAPGDSKAMLLLPDLAEHVSAGQLGGGVSAGQLLWFTGLALAGWCAASRRRSAAVLAVGTGLAALLVLS